MSTAAKPKPEAGDETEVPSITKSAFQRISPQVEEIPAEARAALERLLGHRFINRAPRIRAVLKFMIDALLEGRADTINEHMVGEAVFGRPAEYNPGEDNIVRVTIRHLRDRLEEYYRTDGLADKYVFQIPKGKYVPILTPRFTEPVREPALSAPAQEPLAFAASADPPGVASATRTALFPRWFSGAFPWALVILLGTAVAVLGFRVYQHADTAAAPASRNDGILSLLLANGKPTTVVVTDSNLEAYRMIFRKTVSLDAYLDRSYLQQAADTQKSLPVQGAWTYVGASGQTSMTSMIIASQIQAAAFPERVSMKYPHDLSMREIEHGNYIFLGGPWIDPWEQLFEGRLNFRIVPPPNAPWASSIHNMNPTGSEPVVFAQHEEGSSNVSYVRFVLLRNVINDGDTVLLSGTTDAAVEAGSRFLTSETDMEALLKTFGAASPKQLPSLEVIIETTGLQNVPENSRIIAERVVSRDWKPL